MLFVITRQVGHHHHFVAGDYKLRILKVADGYIRQIGSSESGNISSAISLINSQSRRCLHSTPANWRYSLRNGNT